MSQTEQDFNIVWIDLEMTGLNPNIDHIIEIATVITDGKLNIIEQGPVFAIKQSQTTIDKMDAWNTKTHGESGLIERIKSQGVSLEYAQAQTLDFIKKHVVEKKAPLAGNSICQDRRFLFKEMPELESFLHYRNIDVSTFKEMAARFRPSLLKGFKKKEAHTALADILESIEEMKYYVENFLKI